MRSRPIHEIIKSQALWPAGQAPVPKESRSGSRYKCRLPGVVSHAGTDFPVECREISAGGLRISTQWPIRLSAGQQVLVKVRLGTQSFSNHFTVVRFSRNNQGSLSVHLRLQDE